MITVVNQEEADRDIPKLLALPCKNGISYEPALGPIDFRLKRIREWNAIAATTRNEHAIVSLDWVIIGGESTQGAHKARPFDVDWARSTVSQCKAAGVAPFVKQLGSAPFENHPERDYGGGVLHESHTQQISLNDRAGADPAEWPEDLRVREFPQ